MLFNRRYRNVTVVHRDGRDIMVSAYYYYLRRNDRNTNLNVARHRRRAGIEDVSDIQKNLPRFIQYFFTERIHRYHNFTWAEFVDSWVDREAAYVRYEDLLECGEKALANLLRAHGVEDPDSDRVRAVIERYSFAKQARRNPGEEDPSSFMRKGISGDWKNKFTREACEVFDHFAGSQLVQLGYESNRSWYH